jgi:hypothetical protein
LCLNRYRVSASAYGVIAAGLPRGDADVRQFTHGEFDVVELDEVKLNVLPRRDVPEAAGVFLADVREHAQLRRREEALRNLDPEHLRVFGLTLSVGAAHEPERPPLIGGHLAALVLREHGDELLDIGLAGEP